MKRGFTLLELSVVLTVIALIIGGIMVGRDMLRSAKIQQIVSDLEKYKSAVDTFQAKYNSLPGDMSDATSVWGVRDATPANCITAASTDALTCNGNGDGKIAQSTGSNEAFRFWQHLANADLIVGNFSGVKDGTATYSATANNSPTGGLDRGLWFVMDWGTLNSNNATDFDTQYDNYMAYGAPTANQFPSSSILTPAETYDIDKKIDDGKPGRGSLIARPYNTCTDAGNADALDASYDLLDSSIACMLMFVRAF